MNIRGVKALLLTKTTNVWSDFLPEKKPKPAVVFTHIANGGSRGMSGGRERLFDTWRIMVIATSKAQCQTLANSIKQVDNTNDLNFKNIFVLADGSIPSQPDDKTHSFYVDIKTYNR